MRIKPFFLGAIGCVLCSVAAAESPTTDRKLGAQGDNEGAQLSYVGSRTRLSIGYDSEFDLVGELYQVLREDSGSAWLGTAWLGNNAGGLQLNYHWLMGGEPTDDPAKLSIQKVFLAFDQNQSHDQKLSAGWGFEKQNYFFGAYASAGISGERRVAQSVSSTTDTRNVFDNGVEVQETWLTTTTTDLYERPYDYGIGLRAGHFYEEPLVRVGAGLDYEWGDESASQTTLMVGVEKFFRDTPHSLGVRGEILKKSGHYETDDSDTRGLVYYSYHFGQPYRPAQTPVPTAAAPVRMVKNEISLSSDAFFDFDKSDLRPATIDTLNELAAKLKAAEVVGPVTVVGHTCSIGTVEYNQKLSERRAGSVQRFLLTRGFNRGELQTEGRGELDPKYPNDTEASRRKNRRVDIVVMTTQEVPEKIATAAVTWKSEPVWVERALHNPVDHKRTVDYYRIQKTSTTSELKDRKPVNQPPVARNDAATVPQDSPGQFIDVLANDSDPDGDKLVVSSVTQGIHGTVVNRSDGVVYTPAQGFVGTDTFTYTASDGRGGTSSANVTVTVSESGPKNQPPQANDDRAVTNPDQPVTIGVLANDTDPDGDPLVVSAVTQPANGTVANNGVNVTYTPNASFRGTDVFSYTAGDGRGGTDAASVTVTIRRY